MAGDTNGVEDIFVRDTVTNTTTRVSVATDGTPSNDDSFRPALSRNGRYVAFTSSATNLVPGDTNASDDIFVRDLVNNTTTRVSLSNTGAQVAGSNAGYPAISGDGRYVEFETAAAFVPSDTNGATDIYVRDTVGNTTVRASVATDGTQTLNSTLYAYDGALNADGRYVTFYSNAANLVTGDTNDAVDIFVRDLVNNTTTRVNVATNGAQAIGGDSIYPALSADGRYVVYESIATNLVSGDTNGQSDIFVRDTVNNTTTRVNLTNAGTQATGGTSNGATITEDGRSVVFHSLAADLVTGDTNGVFDVFVRDLSNNTTTRVNLSNTGAPTTSGASAVATLSANGRYVAFFSDATTLVPGDTNAVTDVFVRDRASGVTSGALISEFRERGSTGATDEYVELYNSSGSALDIGGWTLTYVGGGTAQAVTLPFDTTIPAFGHFLLAGSGFSLANYGGVGAAVGNQTVSVGIDDGSALTLRNPSAAAQDTVALTSYPTANGEYAFVRQVDPSTALPVTTANAFTFVATNAGNYAGTNGALTAVLGAASPENLSSPTALLPLKVTPLDPNASASATPNRARDASAIGTNAPQGTLAIRRLVTNNTGAPITKLRFRIVNLSTLNSSGYSTSTQADLRAIASPFTTQSIGGVTVYGTTPDTSIVQSLGGGINSSNLERSSGVLTLSTPIPAGGTRAYDFTFGAQRTGTFTILILFEAANGSSGASGAAARPSTNAVVISKPSMSSITPQ